MAYGYLKEPVEQHKDTKLAVSVLFCKDGKAMVHSRLSDKTFEIDASNIYFKAEPNLEYSEYVTDPPEKKIKLGEDSIFPSKEYGNTGIYGISKRLYIATAALQGLLANSEINRFGTHEGDGYDIIMQSYKLADKMLKQENE